MGKKSKQFSSTYPWSQEAESYVDMPVHSLVHQEYADDVYSSFMECRRYFLMLFNKFIDAGILFPICKFKNIAERSGLLSPRRPGTLSTETAKKKTMKWMILPKSSTGFILIKIIFIEI